MKWAVANLCSHWRRPVHLTKMPERLLLIESWYLENHPFLKPVCDALFFNSWVTLPIAVWFCMSKSTHLSYKCGSDGPHKVPLDTYNVMYQVKHTYLLTYVHAYIPVAVVIILSKAVTACLPDFSIYMYHFYSVVHIVHPDGYLCSNMYAYDYIPQPCCLCG